MKVTFCGTGAGASYHSDRGGSCVMIEDGDAVVIVDCGPGSLRRVWQAGVDYGAISAILITHLHYDHVLGLAEFFNRLGRLGTDPPRILGPAGIDAYVDVCKRLITVSSVDTGRLGEGSLPENLASIRGEQVEPGDRHELPGLTVDAIEVPHNSNVQAFSWRVQAGDSKIVVSGDLKTDESFMAPFAEDADLLVHEAYSQDALEAMIANGPTEHFRTRAKADFEPTHSEISEVAKVAQKAEVKRLALTHLLPHEDEDALVQVAQASYDGEVFAARVGESVQL